MDLAKTPVQPKCPVFGRCGGCSYQDLSYEEELLIKERQLKEDLRDLNIDDTLFKSIIGSPKPYHYRHRLDLKLIKRKSGEVLIGFSPATQKGIIEIDQCAIAHEGISDFINKLKIEAIEKLPQKYRMASLVVRSGANGLVHWGGIGRRSLVMNEEDYFSIELEGKQIFYALDTFFQANLSILSDVIKTIRGFDLWNKKSIFYDLYGGVGLFGLCLEDLSEKVILIEENVHAIKLAKYNIDYNKVSNFDIVKGRVEDTLEACLNQNNYQRVAMIDPPRAGLSSEAREFITNCSKLDVLFYLSCHPESLARDLKSFLNNGWKLESIHPYDFFPKTKHIETLVHLTRY